MNKLFLTITLSLSLSFLFGQNKEVVTPKSTHPVLNIVDTPPEYIGGETALYTYIYQRLKFPIDANMSECTVYVSLVVNEDGTLSNISVKKGFSHSYNEEAIRVVESMPKWRAGSHEGQLARVSRVLPIRFKLY
ncbi:MAG: TonB family protein [Saprospiraceae bacterium]|nr:TonB family protein [Saprospiraceae bacterium]